MSKEIKIGLIGAGWMGKAHTTAFHNARMIFGDDMPVFELVSDVSEDAVAKFAKNMGYNRYTTNWMDVVADPEIDLVDVATPNCMHYEMAKAALEHGKHVFCEKPLSLSAEQSRELADLAKEKGVVNYFRTCCSIRPFRSHGATSTSWLVPAHSATCAATC